MRLLDSISIVNSKQGISPCKHVEAILFNGYGMNLYAPFFTSTVPHLEFSIQFQSNSLIYDKGYSIRQHMIFSLIQLMKEEVLVYRRISKKLNQCGVKTLRGCEWFNTSISSIIKVRNL